MKVKFAIVAVLVLVASVVTLQIAGCGGSGGGSGGGGVAPGGSVTLISGAVSLPADGVSSTVLTATITNASGAAVPQNTAVNFTTTLGKFPNGSKTLATMTENDSGVVVTSLIAGNDIGIARVTVGSVGVTQSLEVTFTFVGSGGVPVGEEFGVSAQYLNISGLWRSNLEDLMTFNVGDYLGNAVQDGTVLEFKTYNTGGQVNPAAAVTTNGISTTILRSVPNPVPQEGFLALTGETQGDSHHRVSAIAVTPAPDQNILFAGTSGGGVYKSTDGGDTWQSASRSSLNSRQGQNWMDPFIKGKRAISVDPDDHNTVYVGTGYLGEGNIYRSKDGGLNWNSNNVEEFYGIFNLTGAVMAVIADGDDDPATDHPYIWAGTEGRGFWFSPDNGRTWGASGGVATTPVPKPGGNTGNGILTGILVSQAAQTETWTVTATVTQGGASVPVFTPVEGSEANGTMSNVTTSTSTVKENWTVTYQGVASSVTGSATDIGAVIDIVVSTAVSETWTLTCIDATPGSEIFSVSGTASGPQPNATIDTGYTGPVSFTIINNTGDPFTVGDIFTFTTTLGWAVSGSVSGPQSPAATGTPYTSDGNQVGFTINEGTQPFTVGDKFTFSTSASETIWAVVGSVSGFQGTRAFNNTPYRSDHGELQFIIFQGSIPFVTGDRFTFSITASPINHGRTVRDMAKVDETHGATAVLYAGTHSGVYRSVDGGRIWDELANFTGDAIFSIAIGPGADGGPNDVVYAGTQNAGFFVTANSGATWARRADGIDGGQSVAVRDILRDPANRKLYITTFLESTSKGDVYVHDLNPDGTLTATAWRKAESGLGGVTLPVYVLAADDPAAPTELFAGGEGINFYRAYSGLSSGNPAWQASTTGLSNLIMARMPILFSGICSLSVQTFDTGENSLYFIVYWQDVNGNPPITGSNITIELVPGDDSATQEITYFDIDYLDGFFAQGTFRDPSDATTDWPYAGTVVYDPGMGDTLVITATPANTLPASPGSSGGTETITLLLP